MCERDEHYKGFNHFTSRKGWKRNCYNRSNNYNGYYNKKFCISRLKNNYNSNIEKNNGVKIQFEGLGPNYFKGKKHHTIRAVISNEFQPWSEEAQEEERKRHLSDTANKLMKKLKLWNSEKSNKDPCNIDFIQRCNEVLSQEMGNSTQTSGKKILHHENWGYKGIHKETGNTLRKRSISYEESEIEKNSLKHLKSQTVKDELVHKRSLLNSTSSENMLKKPHICYFEQDMEKRIQKKVIGELMTMPKENLKKVLVDPRIHPKLELGMAQIVKENRFILAQKFRSLAESKIKNNSQLVCSKIVDDIGCLIDPDLAIDICQLPSEMIKKISDIFQLDFDSITYRGQKNEFDDDINHIDNNMPIVAFNDSFNSDISGNSKISGFVCERSEQSDLIDLNVELQRQNTFRISQEQVESVSSGCVKKQFSEVNNKETKTETCNSLNHKNQIEDIDLKVPISDSFMCKRFRAINGTENIGCIVAGNSSNVQPDDNPNRPYIKTEEIVSVEGFSSDPTCLLNKKNVPHKQCSTIHTGGHNIIKNNVSVPVYFCNEESQKFDAINRENLNKVIMVEDSNADMSCNQLHSKSRMSVGVQTIVSLLETEQLSKESHNEYTEESLIKEVQNIDSIVHLLNKKKFALFLKLINLTTSSLKQNDLKTSLLQTVTNGDLKLLKELNDEAVT